LRNRLFVSLQYLLPQHLLSTVVGWLAELPTPWLKNFFIRCFVKIYRVNMSEAVLEDPTAYPTFNRFFIRQLKPQLRPIAPGENDIACPVDGVIAQIGQIHREQLLQAKGIYFNLPTLLGGDTALAETFYDGAFVTLYLAPSNYHRIHMPITGTLKKVSYIPGKLFSVNRMTSDLIPQLYSRNERLVCVFDTAVGPMLIILVGAMIVGSIHTTWMADPLRAAQAFTIDYPAPLTLCKGTELGYFKLGSTVLVLYGKDKIEWASAFGAQSETKFGQLLGSIKNKRPN
jgi:phosphatidylserine decarboxylase